MDLEKMRKRKKGDSFHLDIHVTGSAIDGYEWPEYWIHMNLRWYCQLGR
jgi:hypothetical protein